MNSHSDFVTGVIDSRLPRFRTIMFLSLPLACVRSSSSVIDPVELLDQLHVDHVPARLVRIAVRIVVIVLRIERRAVRIRLARHLTMPATPGTSQLE